MSEAEVCAHCRFWAEETHLCRRHAPVPIVENGESGSEALRARWLATDREDWCGEYEPLVVEEEAEYEEEEEYGDGDWAEDGSPAW